MAALVYRVASACAALGMVLAGPGFAQVAADPGHDAFDAYRGDRSTGWLGQTRSEVMALNGMVATSQPLASEAGIEVLHAGGNAFDAAVATAAAINVVEPEATGIGGDMFVIAWLAKEHRLVALDAAGRAPMAATLAHYQAKYGKDMPEDGVQSAVVPGAVDGWTTLLGRYGKADLHTVLAPAIRLAEQGFPISQRIGTEWAMSADLLAKDPDTAKIYLNHGKAWGWGDIFRNPDLGKALRLIADGGRDAFYKGPIAQAIVAKSQAQGGLFALSDFDKIHARWVDPISTTFNGYTVHEMPPSTQGFAVLEMINLVEQCMAPLGLKPGSINPKSADFWHLMIEAKKIAYTDLRKYNGDPDFTTVPVARLTSKEYARSQCAKIDMAHAAKPDMAAEPLGGTAYITTADSEGNVVSFIYSVYNFFGSGVTVPGYGFVLNDRGAAFSLQTGHPNAIAPGKRPFYTIIPGFVTKDGKPYVSFGVMYGDQQAQGQAQVLVNMLLFGANPQAAGDAARFAHAQRTNRLQIESPAFDAIGADLKARGHDVHSANGFDMGGYQAIMIDPVTGAYRGASDPRKDGEAIGF
ncbi:gamma-glutamyltransferase [Novosphingobium sp.]|uniref:gamma-glutamyltransferase n=1 Tax=Novosphingobium sp. TaxID=1874826 RepID=UPI003342E12B